MPVQYVNRVHASQPPRAETESTSEALAIANPRRGVIVLVLQACSITGRKQPP